MEPPQGYRRLEQGATTVVVREDLSETLLAAGISDPEAVLAKSPSDLQGRGRLARVDLGPAGSAVLRLLQRGGLLGKLIRRLSLDRQRATSELTVSVQAAARGASVLEVLAAITRRAGLGYHHGLVTREEQGARDLLRVLRETPPGSARWRALRAAGDAVRRLHEAGVDHVDLNVKNVLLRPDGSALVIDLDRCRLGSSGAPWTIRRRNLLRLLRSWVKLGCAEPQTVAPRDRAAFLVGYAGKDRDLGRRVLAAARRARFSWRRLLWRLFPPRYR